MPIDGWDHLELYVGNAKQAAFYYENAFGFTKTAYAGPETGVRDRASYVLEQDDIRLRADERAARRQPDRPVRLRARGRCEGHGAHRAGRGRGLPPGRATRRPRRGRPSLGRGRLRAVELATIATYGENVHTFVNRKDYTGPFLPGFQEIASTNGRPATGVGLRAIDHVVGNVELGRMDYWVEFYERTMGFTNIIHFADEQIHTEYSALMSKVMADGKGKIKFPINEPAEGKRKSQIEEYLEYFGGPGVQHIALQSEDIVRTVETLQDRGIVFLATPDAYYEDVADRVGEIGEDWADLRRLRILADRDEDGYLLQIFSKTAQDRPTLFFEVIERHGARGFGEGNFRALFEAIEREQALRGNL